MNVAEGDSVTLINVVEGDSVIQYVHKICSLEC